MNTHTYYSLRYGCIKPEDLLVLAAENDVDKFVLTDINNTSACLDFVRLSPKYNIEPVLGIDFRNGAEQMYVGIAKNNEGFQELNSHLSHHLHSKEKFEIKAPMLPNAFVIYPFEDFQQEVNSLEEHEFIGVQVRDIPRLRFSILRKHKEKLVITQTVSFRNKRDFNAHRLLRAIDNNCLLSKLPKTEEGHENDRMFSKQDLLNAFEDFPHIIANTEKLLEECSIHFEFGTDKPHKNLKSYTGSEEDDLRLLHKLCEEGLSYRYPNASKAVLERIEKELHIVKEKGFLSYFLINWDITSYARSKGYFYVGRGSGANSIVAYILRITDVDPIDLDLYFERFINLYRKNPPDFDIDFSWMDREDITRYIFERFENTALLAAYNTFQYKAVVRELGKVFGLPKSEIDTLSSGHFQSRQLDHLAQLVLKYSTLIQGFPNHLSIHAGGILIAEKPIHHFTGTFLPPKGYATTQFDMVVAEDVGLYKFDILSQRGLGKIKDALEIVKYNHPEDPLIDIHDMKALRNDEEIKDLLRNAKAIGCFYVESPAMRMLLKKLEVDDYLGLVAASSVIRPGVARSGMMQEYIQRSRFPEKRKNAHPVMLDLMPETFGVMVYQEDVIKVAHYFAGLSLAEADVLRRGMSGKFRSREEFNKAKEAFFVKGQAKGRPADLVAEVWRQVESFAGYAFSKGHSASYAVESYQSLYLKAHYPIEYMVATINNFGGFYRTELYVHEARMHGAKIEAPCVNQSGAQTVLRGKTVFLGFGLVKELERKSIERILEQRMLDGPFLSMENLVKRVNISLDQVAILVRIGAFRFTQKNNKELLWEAHLLLGNVKMTDYRPKELFDTGMQEFSLPELFTANFEHAFNQIELLGFALCDPFGLLCEQPEHEVLAEQLPKCVGKRVVVVGYLVTTKHTRTSNGKRMYFGTFTDRKGRWLDTVHFPPVAEKYRFRGRGIYRIIGKVNEDFGCYHVEAEWMEKLAIIEDPRYSEARTATKRRIANKSNREVNNLVN